MTYTLLPLKGIQSLKVLNAFSTLLLGLKMTPEYLKLDYETFHESFKVKTDGEKETMLRKAVAFVELSPDELEAVLSFAKDQNGVSFSRANISNLGPQEIFEITVAVCMEIGRMQISLISESEKKNYPTAASTSGVSL